MVNILLHNVRLEPCLRTPSLVQLRLAGHKGNSVAFGEVGGPPTCSIVFRSASLSRCQPSKEGGSSGVCVPTHGGVSAARGPTCHRGRVSSPFPRTGGRARDHSAGVTRERWVGCELGALAGGWAGAWPDATSLPAPGPTHQQPSDFLGDNGTGWGCQTQCLPENLKPDSRPLPPKHMERSDLSIPRGVTNR